MSAALRLYLIRHGETEWSLSGKHTGRSDIPLTGHGEDEARALASCFRDIPFAHVLTSPRQRARQTCELAGLGPTAKVEPDLAEWDYGEYRRPPVSGYLQATTRLDGVSRRLSWRRNVGASFRPGGPDHCAAWCDARQCRDLFARTIRLRARGTMDRTADNRSAAFLARPSVGERTEPRPRSS